MLDRPPLSAPDITSLPEADLVANLQRRLSLTSVDRKEIAAAGADLVRRVRAGAEPGLMESFLAEYGLGSPEGTALMSLAEALLRVPDAKTADALIADKLGVGDWSAHFGRSRSRLVNLSSRGLALASGLVAHRSSRNPAVRTIGRLGAPFVRLGARAAMRVLGDQFVFAQSIEAASRTARRKGPAVRHSFDMLGEAARTRADAERYFAAYRRAIAVLAGENVGRPIDERASISVKLSALHPRYEPTKGDAVVADLSLTLGILMRDAADAGIALTIDAEETERLEMSLEIVETALEDPALASWQGFGIVVQAYQRRAINVIDRIVALGERTGRRIAVRLVKGAYWDAEIKRAQVLGLTRFPVFTRKAATDLSYLVCAEKLLDAGPVIYPQFATHNAHTACAVLHMARSRRRDAKSFELQRLHGMGKALHEALAAMHGTTCRIYAPVGPHRELLAYLVRRLLENGANGSFVNQLTDESIAPETACADPLERLDVADEAITLPAAIFPSRISSRGHDLGDAPSLARLEAARAPFRTEAWIQAGATLALVNPARPGDTVGGIDESTPDAVDIAIGLARAAAPAWASRPVGERAQILRGAADTLEAETGELLALLTREAGKTLPDAIAELREAVDFLRYYAAEAEALGENAAPRGVFACISPWNFPLAIFLGQVAAALVTGNAVLAKPAEATPLVARRAVALLHAAGVPQNVLQLLPGPGGTIGTALVSDPRIDGVCFTGSLKTARAIERAMAKNLDPRAPLIAETGGINAMIVDSTALPEQVVRDVLASAFQSAGQRCSALRVLLVEEEIAEGLIEMIAGAMDDLELGDPWDVATDVGPVIDRAARDRIEAHIARFAANGKVLKRLAAPTAGWFVGPALIRIDRFDDVEEEIFGPVLHVATFRAGEIDAVIELINRSGYGLTFGLHTRIESRADAVGAAVMAGNVYVNRNQIGAVVGSQPFGGEGLSGTGPKAGGPNYLPRFLRTAVPADISPSQREMPGPTGERNLLVTHPRRALVCLGPTAEDIAAQMVLAENAGVATIVPADPDDLAMLAGEGFDAVASFGSPGRQRAVRTALAAREGALIPLICGPDDAPRLRLERHRCTDTTAAGGNASLLALAHGTA